MVFDTATSAIQTKGESIIATDCLRRILFELDCHSGDSVSSHYVPLLLHGTGSHHGDGHFVSLAHDIHAAPFLFVCIESQVDV